MFNQVLFNRKTKQSDFPFQIIVKQQYNQRVLYVSYGEDIRNGGGIWSEDLNNIHPRTVVMIEERLGKDTVSRLLSL